AAGRVARIVLAYCRHLASCHGLIAATSVPPVPPNLVVLDRDGVINRDSDAFIKSPSEWIPIAGSIEAIALLSRCGAIVAVASNQSGIGRKLFDRRALYAIHRKMRRAVKKAGGSIDRIVYCPHLPDDGCDCRKPAPGLLLRLGRHYGIAMHGIPVIGDTERDLMAAEAAGARPVLVLTGNGRRTKEELEGRGVAVEYYEDLLSAAKVLVGEPAPGRLPNRREAFDGRMNRPLSRRKRSCS
ncbi:MAG: D-glycero-beta-D-manno-heptose 1,7-bisphosphate 7-phosphatase, partial [Woeseiaceae bacterium]